MPFAGGPNTPVTNPRWRTYAIFNNKKNRHISAMTDRHEIWHLDAYWPSSRTVKIPHIWKCKMADGRVHHVFDSDMMYRTLSRGRRRRSGDVPGLMDLPSDSDGFTLRRDAEVPHCSRLIWYSLYWLWVVWQCSDRPGVSSWVTV